MQNGRSESANTMQVTVKAFTVVPSRSGVLRPPAEREVLNLFGARMAAVSLSGFIFFGSSLSISDQVTRAESQVPPVLHLIIRVHKAPPLQSDLQQAMGHKEEAVQCLLSRSVSVSEDAS